MMKKLEILIVDGNSSDKTREIALKMGARVHIEPRKGYGRAYKTGFSLVDRLECNFSYVQDQEPLD